MPNTKRALTILASALALGIAYSGSQAVALERNDIPAAAARSATHGWPHKPTITEARQVARFVVREIGQGAASAEAYCVNLVPNHAAWWQCRTRITFTHNELTGARLKKPRTYRFRMYVRVWEDGSAQSVYL